MTCSRSRSRHRLGAFALDAAFDAEGGLTALFGRSGSGKTSLVNVIAGLIRPEHGRIVVDGEVLVDTERGVFVPRAPAPHRLCLSGRPAVPASDGAAEPALRPLVRARRRSGRRRIEHVVEMLGIGALLDRRPANLSGGEKQRVAIGRALLREPAPAADGRAAGRARRGAQGRDPALYRAAARRGAACRSSMSAMRSPRSTRLATTMVVLSEGRVAAVGPDRRGDGPRSICFR